MPLAKAPSEVPSQAVMDEARIATFNPWLFVPLLYFMQAIPVTVVQELATVFYKDMGIANEPITRWTSLIALPWSLQILLGPLVDLTSTKRAWILGGQVLCAAGLIATALVLKIPLAFEISLLILGATAFASAFCNIATDGFYIIAMTKEQQAKYVGVQSTCYRLGRLFCVGILVQVSGKLAAGGTDQMTAWSIVLAACGGIYALGHLLNRVTVPRISSDEPIVSAEPGEIGRNVWRTLAVLGLGLGGYFALNSLVRLGAHGLWEVLGADPEGQWKGWMLPNSSDLLGLQLGGISAELVQFAISATMFAICLRASKRTIRNTPMGDAFASFVRQPGIVPIFFFILFYRFGEAMVSKMSPLFLKDSIANGGLAIPNDQLGVIKGYFGVAGIVIGGLLGGWLVSRVGLRKSFIPLALCMHLPNLLYLALASTHVPLNIVHFGSYFGDVPLTLVGVDFVDQFGYGFGFAAYMVYLMQVAQRGRYRTAHFAIGTGAGALCIAVAGVVSGIIQSNFGYAHFFLWVMFLSIPGVLTVLFIPIDSQPQRDQ